MARLSVLDSKTTNRLPDTTFKSTYASQQLLSDQSDSDSSNDSQSDSEDDSIRQVMGGKQRIRKIVDSDDDDDSLIVEKTGREANQFSSPTPSPKASISSQKQINGTAKPWKNPDDDNLQVDNKAKPWNDPTNGNGRNGQIRSSSASTTTKDDDDITRIMNNLSLSKKSDLPTKSDPQAKSNEVPKQKPKVSTVSALKPWVGSNRPPQKPSTTQSISKGNDTQPPASKSESAMRSLASSPSKPLPPQPISSTASTNSGFFERLQKAQQKQANNRIFLRPNSSGSNSFTVPTTFGSPVRSFKSNNGTLMEPLTPRSSQWSRPIDIAKAKASKPVSFDSMKPPSDEDAISSDAFRAPPKWGMKGTSSLLGQANSAAMEGNGFSYMDPTKTTDAVKGLLSSMNEDDEIDDDPSHAKVEGLEVTLLPHQIKGLKFLRKREHKDQAQKGGLLCDDMGLGKTIQSIALILSNSYVPDKNLENAIKTTLVIAPLALAEQWADEIRNKAPLLRVMVHHGPGRAKNSLQFGTYDVIVTTFQIVTSEHQNNGPLFDKLWWRIIIDEAHTIKNPKAKSSIASYNLKSQIRWCLTGTPIQNNVDELYSLFKFLQISPLDDAGVWKAQITRPIGAGQGNVALKRLHVILSAVMLRRTKEVLGKSGVKLPARTKHLVLLEFDEKERRYYDALHNKVSSAVRDIMSESGRSNYMSALLLLLRLRQVCDDIRLANGKIDSDDKESVITAATAGKNDDADDLADLLGGLNIDKGADSYLGKLGLSESKSELNSSSTKIKKVIEIVHDSPTRKTIIFSQFTSMLDLIEPSMKESDIKFVRYDGSMSKAHRENSLRKLKDDPSVQVLLCSLKCGAYGLNLTCANQVVLLDPWWNPMVGEQGIDRVHRLGQTHDVDVYELIVKDTVEDKIRLLQEKKRQLSKEVIEKGESMSSGANRLNIGELMSLFS